MKQTQLNYFIDFEASFERHMIISVGCICEDGREFYSLVHTDDPIGMRIENLTGITQEEIDQAPSQREVFEHFSDWCDTGALPVFYCYGSSDPEFCYNSLQEASSFKEASILSYLCLNLKDYSEQAMTHFHATQTISLERLGKHYDDEMEDQNHNALDDAKLLKKVFEEIENRPEETYIFKDYMGNRRSAERGQVLRYIGDEVAETYASLKEAAEWVRKQSGNNGGSGSIEEKIKRASKDNIRYMKYKWKIL